MEINIMSSSSLSLDYSGNPHLEWLNEHFTSEFVPNKEWVALSDT